MDIQTGRGRGRLYDSVIGMAGDTLCPRTSRLAPAVAHACLETIP